MPEVKFCGMTRPEDARAASRMGARYVGVILAGGPRNLDLTAARAVLDAAGTRVNRVAVFGAMPAAEIARHAADLVLDVVQLHADPTPDTVDAVRERFGGRIWAACRLEGSALPAGADELADSADALVLDRWSRRGLGGTGETLPWEQLAGVLHAVRERTMLVLAGGLRPENVAEAIRHVAPSVVDVSSGVETAPGVKDHDRMRAFMSVSKPAEDEA